MIQVALCGVNGAMGKTLQKYIAALPDMKIIAGIDNKQDETGTPDFPVYEAPALLREKADVIIDFSHYSITGRLLDYCAASKTPVVVATTALDETALARLREVSKEIAVFRSANMSLGINLLAKVMEVMVPPLEDSFNVEIIEKHHTKKTDSPSGTALMLADAVNDQCKEKKNYIYGRHSKADACSMADLGIHAVRGGTIPGEHTILFAGGDEIIEVTHRALSKNIFAHGAIQAAAFLAGKPPGLYSMADVLASKL